MYYRPTFEFLNQFPSYPSEAFKLQQGVGMTSQRTRDRLIRRLIDLGIADETVLQAMRVVPRHCFLDEAMG
ncbi:MAG: hypothetical protein IE937_05805, partial [Gammaproteobacteria bacterium]|nr:hypothetical protein [Gammaproteobacteria bacterium]